MSALIDDLSSVWVDKQLYDEAERIYYEKLAKGAGGDSCGRKVSLAGEVAKARERIKQSLENVDEIQIPSSTSDSVNVQSKIASVETKVAGLRKDFEQLKVSFTSLEKLVKDIDKKLSIVPGFQGIAVKTEAPICQKPGNSCQKPGNVCQKPGNVSKPPPKDDDDDVDLFGSESEEESEEAKKIKEQRLAEYAAKKSKKQAIIAKSNIILDVKPWDDETDMKLLEQEVRKVSMDGLVWGASKLVPLAYGIKKLQISCVVEDEKVSVDDLQEKIQDAEDYVQSVDIAAFNKV